MIDVERQLRAQDRAPQHRKYQHEVPSNQTSNSADRTLADDDLPPRGRRRVPEAPATKQEFRRLARHGHRTMGAVAASKPVARNTGDPGALARRELRLNHASSGNLAGNRASSHLAGDTQGMLATPTRENLAVSGTLRCAE